MAERKYNVDITAQDGFSGAFDKLRAKMAASDGAAAQLKSSMLNLAAGVLSTGAALEAMRKAIGLGDDLKRMADTTGLAISKLDQLDIVAKLNSASLDDMAKAFKFLGKSMVDSSDASSKAGQLFKALGVSVKDASGNFRSQNEVMADVAASLETIQDETVRAAVGTEIFGKSYLTIAAALRNFKSDQEAANEILVLYGGVSQRAADLSDELGDKMTLLGEGSKRALLGALVPGMAAASQALTELINGGGQFQKGFGDVISSVATFVTSSLISLKGAFQVTGVTIAAVLAAIATKSLEPLKAAMEDIGKIETETKAAQMRIEAAAKVGGGKFAGWDNSDQVTRAAAAQDRLNKSQADSAKIAGILAPAQKKVKEEFADFAGAIATLNANLQALTGGGKMTALQKAQEDINKALREGKKVSWDQIEAYLALAEKFDLASERLAAGEEIARRLTAAFEEQAKATHALVEEQDKATKAAEEAATKAEFELETFGMTEQAVNDLRFARERERLVKLQSATDSDLVYAGLQKEIDALDRARNAVNGLANKNAAKEMAASWQETFNQIGEFGSDLFVGIYRDGSDYFKKLWGNFVDWALAAIGKVAAQQLLISVSLGGSGVANAGGLGSLLSGGSGGGGIMSTLSNLGSLSGLTSLTSGGIFAGGGALNSFALGGMGQALGLSAAGLDTAGGVALTTFGSAIGAAIPIAALAAIAIPMIVKLFDEGPAMRKGTFASGSGLQGGNPLFQGKSAFGTFGVMNDQWFSDSDMGEQFKAFIAGIQGIDDAISKLVGKDMTGKISEMLSKMTTDFEAGMEHEGVLFGSIMKERYTAILNEITKDTLDAGLGRMVEAFSGTGEALATFVTGLVAVHMTLKNLGEINITKLFGEMVKTEDIAKLAGAGGDVSATFNHVVEVFSLTNSAAQILSGNFDDVTDAFGAVGLASLEAREKMIEYAGGADKLAAGLAFYYDKFYTEAEKSKKAVDDLNTAFAALGVTVPKDGAAFRTLMESLDTPTEAGLKLKTMLLALAPAFYDLYGGIEAVGKAVDQLNRRTAEGRMPGMRHDPRAATDARTQRGTTPWQESSQTTADTGSSGYGGDAIAVAAQYVSKARQLEIQIMQLEGKTTEALTAQRDDELATLDATDASLQRRVYQLQDEAAATAKTNGLKAIEQSLMLATAKATGDTGSALAIVNAQRDKEREGLSQTDLAIQNHIYALQDEADARQEAEQSTRLEIRLMELQGNAAGALALQRQLELAAMTAEQQFMAQQIYALEDAAAAKVKAEQAAADAQRAADQEQAEHERRVNEARSQLSAAYQKESSALQQTIDKFRSFSDALKEFRDRLAGGSMGDLSPEARYLAAKAQYEATSASALGGDQAAIGKLQGVSQDYLDAARQYFASSQGFSDAMSSVQATLNSVIIDTAATADVAQLQLDALNASVSGLLDINDSVLSVAEAIRQLQAALVPSTGGSGGAFSSIAEAEAWFKANLPSGVHFDPNAPASESPYPSMHGLRGPKGAGELVAHGGESSFGPSAKGYLETANWVKDWLESIDYFKTGSNLEQLLQEIAQHSDPANQVEPGSESTGPWAQLLEHTQKILAYNQPYQGDLPFTRPANEDEQMAKLNTNLEKLIAVLTKSASTPPKVDVTASLQQITQGFNGTVGKIVEEQTKRILVELGE